MASFKASLIHDVEPSNLGEIKDVLNWYLQRSLVLITRLKLLPHLGIEDTWLHQQEHPT